MEEMGVLLGLAGFFLLGVSSTANYILSTLRHSPLAIRPSTGQSARAGWANELDANPILRPPLASGGVVGRGCPPARTDRDHKGALAAYRPTYIFYPVEQIPFDVTPSLPLDALS